ncbi:hypothetical protein OS493_039514, partial [Desmophyllum pertusum]
SGHIPVFDGSREISVRSKYFCVVDSNPLPCYQDSTSSSANESRVSHTTGGLVDRHGN